MLKDIAIGKAGEAGVPVRKLAEAVLRREYEADTQPNAVEEDAPDLMWNRAVATTSVVRVWIPNYFSSNIAMYEDQGSLLCRIPAYWEILRVDEFMNII